jgi:CBS domain-containing protein
MGKDDIIPGQDEAALRRFTRQLIQDVRALEHLLQEDMFESGVRRIGAEQELFLIDDRWQPAAIIERVLAENTDDRVVSELMKFNLEFNLEPRRFEGACLRRIEESINEVMEDVHGIVEKLGARAVMAGILPTISLTDLEISNMTPSPRYRALNDAISRLRGGPAELQIRGTDELYIKHDSITLEGCNTSFQTHFQVHPDEFASLYNIAQTVAGPVLAAATNSPTLFGKRLWRETRIALFQQAVDTRSSNLYLREMSPRVHFGTKWVDESVLEIFKEDISRFRVLLTAGEVEDPFEALRSGRVPELQALQLHNGTVYRWNRACYGITDGKPHLRIENRILPSGPTTIDEVSNAAFWFGLVSGLAHEHPDVRRIMKFEDAKSNFVAAARFGLASQLTWFNGHSVPAHELIVDELLPLAREGLRATGIDEEDIDRYLGVIEARVTTRQTGSQWQLDSLAAMEPHGTRAERLSAIVAATVDRQRTGQPVHTWSRARLPEGLLARRLERTRVEQYMSTDLVTVNEEELVDLVACLMDWQRIRHVLVEDHEHRLVGLVTHRNLLRFLADRGGSEGPAESLAVKEIMIRDPVIVSPDTSTVEAVRRMRSYKISSLPVVREGRLIGIITEKDFIHIAGQLLDDSMAGELGAVVSESAPPEAGGGF